MKTPEERLRAMMIEVEIASDFYRCVELNTQISELMDQMFSGRDGPKWKLFTATLPPEFHMSGTQCRALKRPPS